MNHLMLLDQTFALKTGPLDIHFKMIKGPGHVLHLNVRRFEMLFQNLLDVFGSCHGLFSFYTDR